MANGIMFYSLIYSLLSLYHLSLRCFPFSPDVPARGSSATLIGHIETSNGLLQLTVQLSFFNFAVIKKCYFVFIYTDIFIKNSFVFCFFYLLKY